MSDHNASFALDDFERQLAALQPAAAGLDRDAMLYAAGRAAAASDLSRQHGGQMHRVALALAASVVIAASFAGLWWREVRRPVPVIVQQTPAAPTRAADSALPPTSVEITPAAAVALPANSYLHLRQLALREGIDALPDRHPHGRTFAPPTARAFQSPFTLEES